MGWQPISPKLNTVIVTVKVSPDATFCFEKLRMSPTEGTSTTASDDAVRAAPGARESDDDDDDYTSGASITGTWCMGNSARLPALSLHWIFCDMIPM